MAELTVNYKFYNSSALLFYFLSKHSTVVGFEVNSSGLKINFLYCEEP